MTAFFAWKMGINYARKPLKKCKQMLATNRLNIICYADDAILVQKVDRKLGKQNENFK